MRLTIALLMCCGLSIVTGALESGRTPRKQVEADCRRNTTENSIELNFFFALNGDPAEAFMAVEGSVFRRPDGSTNEASCNFGGSLETVLTLHSKVFLDGRTSQNPCGVTMFSQVNLYQWYFEVREYYDRQATEGIITDMDARYSVSCSLDNAQNPMVSPTTEIRVIEYDDEVDAIRVRPSSQMSVLTRPPGQSYFVQEPNSGIRRGQDVKLRVQTRAKKEGFRNVALDHYGSYIHSCEFRTSLTGDRTMFIQQNGCPNNQFPEMVGGFRYTTTIPSIDNYEWYLSESSAFILARENTNANIKRYYITCYLGHCYGPKLGDAKCNDYCNTNRKRRAVNNELDRISISVEIKDEPVTQTEERSVAESGTMVIAIVSSVTIIVFVAIVVLVILVCLRRRQQEREDWATSSTAGSNLNLPQHLIVQQVRH